MSLIETRRKSFRGDIDVVSDVVNKTQKKRHSFRGDVDLEKEKCIIKSKRRSSFRSSYVDREDREDKSGHSTREKKTTDDSLDVLLMNGKVKIKKAHSESFDKKKKRGGSLNIKRNSSFFDRFRRSRSHDAPKTPFTAMYDCEMDAENLSKFRQRRHSRNIENCVEKLLLSSVTLTLDSSDNNNNNIALDSTSHLAMEVKRMKFEETERTIMELERKKKEEMKKVRRRRSKKKRRRRKKTKDPTT